MERSLVDDAVVDSSAKYGAMDEDATDAPLPPTQKAGRAIQVDRRCRDLLFAAIFVIFWLGMLYASFKGYDEGDPVVLVYGPDYNGNVCNRNQDGADLKGFKTRYWLNPNEVIAADNNAISLKDADSICLKSCPNALPEGSLTWVCKYPEDASGRHVEGVTFEDWASMNYDYFELLDNDRKQSSFLLESALCPVVRVTRGADALKSALCPVVRVTRGADVLKGPCYPAMTYSETVFHVCQFRNVEASVSTSEVEEFKDCVERCSNVTDPEEYISCVNVECQSENVLSEIDTRSIDPNDMSDEGAMADVVNGALGDGAAVMERYFGDIVETWELVAICGAALPLVLSAVWLITLRYFAGALVWVTIIAANVFCICITLFAYIEAGVIGNSVLDNERSCTTLTWTGLDIDGNEILVSDTEGSYNTTESGDCGWEVTLDERLQYSLWYMLFGCVDFDWSCTAALTMVLFWGPIDNACANLDNACADTPARPAVSEQAAASVPYARTPKSSAMTACAASEVAPPQANQSELLLVVIAGVDEILGSDEPSPPSSNGTVSITNTTVMGDDGSVDDAAKNALLAAAIISTIFTVILFISTIMSIRRLKITIAIIQVAAKAVAKAPFVVLYPIVPFLALALFFAYWCASVVYIYSSGEIKFASCAARLLTSEAPAGVAYECYVSQGADVRLSSTVVWDSLKRVCRYHVGSIALGSLIIAVVTMIRAIVSFITYRLKNLVEKNPVLQFVMCCVHCGLWCLDKVITAINRTAYVMIAIDGESFCSSAARGTLLTLENILTVAVVNMVGDFLLLLGRLAVAAGCGILAWVALDYDQDYADVSSPLVPVIFVAIAAFIVATVFMSVVEVVIDTMTLAYCDDVNDNGGTPVLAPEELKRAIGMAWDDIQEKCFIPAVTITFEPIIVSKGDCNE
eukprot:gene17713-21103_t